MFFPAHLASRGEYATHMPRLYANAHTLIKSLRNNFATFVHMLEVRVRLHEKIFSARSIQLKFRIFFVIR